MYKRENRYAFVRVGVHACIHMCVCKCPPTKVALSVRKVAYPCFVSVTLAPESLSTKTQAKEDQDQTIQDEGPVVSIL